MERCVVKILGAKATNFAACFYNEKKVAEGTAECISMRNFGELGDYNLHSPVVLSRYFQKIADHNKFVKHPQKHICWSFPGKANPEQLQQLLKDAQTTMDRLGYKDQPQVFWVHNDTGNTHIHGASVTVSVKNGLWIDNWKEGRRARRIMDQLRGVSTMNAVDKLLEYKFENREQFKSLLISTGYRCHLDEQNSCYDIYRGHELIGSVSTEELDARIAANGKNKDTQKDVITSLRGILLDRRRRSLKMNVTAPIKVNTKDGEHTVTRTLSEVKTRFNGDKGIDIEGERKAQFKKFLMDLKKELGISIVFSQYQDGKTKGYTLIDHKDGLVFKGSDVVDLQKLLNPDWRKGQEKDTVLSADDAASMADDIRQSENLPLAIEQQLERLGIEFDPDAPYAMQNFGYESEEENRSQAVEALHQVIALVRNGEDATEYGAARIAALAQEAVDRAVCADDLRLSSIQEEEDRQMFEHSRQPEIARARNRLEAAKNITASEIGNFVMDFLDDFNIEHSPYGDYVEPKSDYSIDESIRMCLEKLQAAVEAKNPYDRRDWGNVAIFFAKSAENRWKEESKAKTKPAAQPKPKQETTKVVPFLYFVDVRPTVFVDENYQTCVKVKIDGLEYDPVQISADLARWYNEEENKETAGFQLALHYFRNEIQARQIENYHRRFFSAGALPYGISIDRCHTSYSGSNSNMSGKSWVKGWFTYREQQFDMTVNIPNEEYRKYYTAPEKDKEDIKRKLVSRFIGPKLLENVQVPSISELINDRFESPAAADTIEALDQSVETFKDFTQDLCMSFTSACGDIATAYFDAVMSSHGITPSGGGGGHDTGGWGRKKDDDDWFKVGTGLMGLHSHKKGGLRLKP